MQNTSKGATTDEEAKAVEAAEHPVVTIEGRWARLYYSVRLIVLGLEAFKLILKINLLMVGLEAFKF